MSNSDPIFSIQIGDRELRVNFDDDPINPREYDNFGKVICFLRNYTIGDKHNYADPDAMFHSILSEVISDPDTEERIKEKAWVYSGQMVKENPRRDRNRFYHEYIVSMLETRGTIILPVYAYIHSGVAISVSPFSCSFDSGTAGFTYVTREEILKNWGKKRLTKKLTQQAKDLLLAEFESLANYVQGDLYRYEIRIDGDYETSCGSYQEEEYCQIEGLFDVIFFDGKIADLAKNYEISADVKKTADDRFDVARDILRRAVSDKQITEDLHAEYLTAFEELEKLLKLQTARRLTKEASKL